MALQHLDEREQLLLMSCVRVAAESSLFPDWEFHTLFGLSRSQVDEIAAQGPTAEDRHPDVAQAINNAVVNLLGYPHGRLEWVYEVLGADEQEIQRVYNKWRASAG